MAPAPLLPTSSASVSGPAASAYPSDGGQSMLPRTGGLGVRSCPLVFRRLTRFKLMDFELAFWQLSYLLVAPRRVYKQTYHHKQTKNRWARDDPAMLLLISGALAIAGVIWSLIYRQSLFNTISTILLMVFRDFLLSCLVVATVLYVLANKLLLSPSSPYQSSADSAVEFAYAFDVAVNAFFPAFLTLYVGLAVLAPVVVRSNWVCLLVGNTLFLVAGVQYIYITYLGYAALPFVVRSELLLAPLLPLFVGYLLSMLGFNVSRHALELYFGVPWSA